MLMTDRLASSGGKIIVHPGWTQAHHYRPPHQVPCRRQIRILLLIRQVYYCQDFLSQMLGTRRSTVTVSAGTLQKAGLISYSRGRVTVLDRPLLEEAACDCYAVL